MKTTTNNFPLAMPAPRCVISARSIDGLGHQLQSKLSCLAAAHALPGVHYAEHGVYAVQYVTWSRERLMAAVNVNLTQHVPTLGLSNSVGAAFLAPVYSVR